MSRVCSLGGIQQESTKKHRGTTEIPRHPPRDPPRDYRETTETSPNVEIAGNLGSQSWLSWNYLELNLVFFQYMSQSLPSSSGLWLVPWCAMEASNDVAPLSPENADVYRLLLEFWSRQKSDRNTFWTFMSDTWQDVSPARQCLLSAGVVFFGASS